MTDRSLAITVVIAVWDDYVRYLEDCLANLLRQENCNLAAVVVVDNRSSVPMQAVATNAEIVRSPLRLSLGAARNLGLQRVQTDLVCFADVDDPLLPGTFEFLARRMRARRELMSCACSLLRWYAELDLTFPHWWPDTRAFSLVRYPSAFAVRNAFVHQFPMASAALHRTNACVESGGLSDIQYGEDWGLANSLLSRGPVELHRRPGRLYRARPGSMGFPTQVSEVQAACAAIRERLRRDDRTSGLMRALIPFMGAYHQRLARTIVARNERELADIKHCLSSAALDSDGRS